MAERQAVGGELGLERRTAGAGGDPDEQGLAIDVEQADAYIARSAESMLLAVGDAVDKASKLSPSLFPAADQNLSQ